MSLFCSIGWHYWKIIGYTIIKNPIEKCACGRYRITYESRALQIPEAMAVQLITSDHKD